jgi:hypothetical protein
MTDEAVNKKHENVAELITSQIEYGNIRYDGAYAYTDRKITEYRFSLVKYFPGINTLTYIILFGIGIYNRRYG